MTMLYRQSIAGLRAIVVFTVLLGVVYPLVVWGVAHLPGLAGKAEGSIITQHGAAVGSSRIGIDPVPANPAADPYFHTRPSATAKDVLGPGDPSTSAPSNKSAFNKDLVAAVAQRRDLIAAREGVAPAQVPSDAVTASGSGLDPDISPDYAQLQATRVARVTGLPVDKVKDLIEQNTDGRTLGIFGDPGVNVTELNLAIAKARG
nr:K(+)-transporting ATPase subunit C [Pseudonocardia spinosispora]